MAGELIGGALLGIVFQQAYNGSVRIYKVFSGSARMELEEKVKSLLPAVKEICETSSGAPSKFSLQKFKQFHDKIIEGNRRIDECQKSCICLRSCRVEKCVKKLEKDINEFIRTEQPFIVTLQQIQAQISQFNQLETVINGQTLQFGRLETVIEGQNTHFAQLENVIEGQNHQSTQMENLTRLVENLLEVQGLQRESLYRKVTQISRQNSQSTQLENVIEGQNRQCTHLENVGGEMESVSGRVEQEQQSQISQQDESHPPDPSPCLVGFDDHIMELKKFVLVERVNVVGIIAMGGAGKSTLAKALCKDIEIKGYFMGRIVYILVSESPDLLSILEIMWKNIIGGTAPNFKNVKDAHMKLEFRIKLTKSEPILIVLDDVWSKSHLEKLLFEGGQCTTLVTTRDKYIIPEGAKTRVYELPLLQKEHALSLFCHHAFGQPTIPIGHDKKLVTKVVEECNGLPLALKVFGSSLYDKSDFFLKSTRDVLATAKAPRDYQINDLLKRLEASINALNPCEKQCFLDLAVFPKGRTIPANVLLDIWVYVRRMERDHAFLLLRKFEAGHLLDLKRDHWAPESTDDSMNGYYVSQHDVMRELALFLAEQDNEVHFSRLFMPQRQSQLPHEWQTDGDRISRAQIVSIHTGSMKDKQWPAMDFPVAEALVLPFSATEYCIPTFLDTMKRLKVLIIHNDNSKPAKLCGLGGFHGPSQLRTLYLERLIVPPLHEDCKGLKSLEKMSLVLCAGLGKDTIFNFPVLSEMNVDYCIDLEELPAGLCSSGSLIKLSVTHCHRLVKLPDEMGTLESLVEIRLCESPSLKALPPSISGLRKLECLDISSCMGLKVTKQGRSELKSTLEAVAELPSLKRVICDERNEWLFKRSSRTNLEVQAVEEEEPNLDWLDVDERN